MTWTSSPVTDYMDKYFEARPQLDPPMRGTLGYDVPLPIAAVLHSMMMELKKATTPQRRPVKVEWVDCGREGAEEVMWEKDGFEFPWRPIAQCGFPTGAKFKFRRRQE